jgi:Tol biopolymer transport system component
VAFAAAPAWSPDAAQIIFLGEAGIENWGDQFQASQSKTSRGIWVIDSKGGNAQQLRPTDERIENIALSPDGTMLAYEVEPPDAEDYIVIIDVKGGQQISRFPGEQPAWNPDGQSLLVRYFDGLWQVDLKGQKGKQITDLGTDFFPFYSPDGRYLAFASNAKARDGEPMDNWEIYLLPLVNGEAQGEARRLSNRPGTDTSPVFSPDGREIYFLSDKASPNWSIQAISLDGSTVREIVSDIGPHPTWGLIRPAINW